MDRLRILEKRLLQNQTSDYRRYLFDVVDFNAQMIAIVGARGVGKTTLMLQYLKNKFQVIPITTFRM